MLQVTSREFRDKQASLLNIADQGEQVVIRRRGKRSYMLTPIYDSDITITPELEQKIEREQVAKVTGTNKDEGPSVKGPVRRTDKKIYPNDLCPCGSGKKYKNCCGRQA